MKNLLMKKTNKIYSYNQLAGSGPADTIIGDPTNTTITVLTTVSGPARLGNRGKAVKLRI